MGLQLPLTYMTRRRFFLTIVPLLLLPVINHSRLLGLRFERTRIYTTSQRDRFLADQTRAEATAYRLTIVGSVLSNALLTERWRQQICRHHLMVHTGPDWHGIETQMRKRFLQLIDRLDAGLVQLEVIMESKALQNELHAYNVTEDPHRCAIARQRYERFLGLRKMFPKQVSLILVDRIPVAFALIAGPEGFIVACAAQAQELQGIAPPEQILTSNVSRVASAQEEVRRLTELGLTGNDAWDALAAEIHRVSPAGQPDPH